MKNDYVTRLQMKMEQFLLGARLWLLPAFAASFLGESKVYCKLLQIRLLDESRVISIHFTHFKGISFGQKNLPPLYQCV